MQDLQTWLTRIDGSNADFRHEIGHGKLGLLKFVAFLLAAPRLLAAALAGRSSSFQPGEFQRPWVPRWPGLAAIPIHAATAHPWTERVHAARHDIADEMAGVQEAFTRARYDSEFNPTHWNTYYFYLQGKPVDRHLAACPRTAAILRSLPHNGLHICFSAIQPGGRCILIPAPRTPA